MIPIHKLLDRIRWDTEYAKADFKIGYYDRIEGKIIIVPIKQVCFESSNHFSLDVLDDSTELHMIPLHRIRQVYKDDELIWERPID
ncbi:DUF504 domain-containing protein [Desulfosediminicola sp.]|uniref:DUF504 domain-containing protein n=1 Tax=Desulfosediminicola sp. TaxID=2886825 RepID=UPI003AF22E8C